jgi:hypothetical protein
MENKRQEPGEMKGVESGAMGQSGEQFDHKRIRSLSIEVPGTEPMLSDPGEPHKCIEQHSSLPEQKSVSGRQHKSGEPQRGSQEHPLLGKEAVSMQNEREERARRKAEEAERSPKKKPAA